MSYELLVEVTRNDTVEWNSPITGNPVSSSREEARSPTAQTLGVPRISASALLAYSTTTSLNWPTNP